MRYPHLLGFFLFFPGIAAAEVKLEWSFALGDSFLLEKSNHQKQEITVKGRSYAQGVESTWRVRFTIMGRYWGKWLLQATLEEVVYKSHGSPGSADFDKKLAAALKGATLGLTLTTRGQVIKVRGYDAFIQKLSEGKAGTEMALRALFPEEGLEETFGEMFSFLPGKAVQVRDKWERGAIDPVPPFGSFQSRLTFQYDGLKEGFHSLSYTQQSEFKKAKDPPEVLRLVKGELTGEEGKGHYLFDAGAGRLVRGERTLTVRGQVTIEAAGAQAEMRFVSQNRVQVRLLPSK